MREKLIEGFKDKGSPDMKYYAFDWDDNIVHMPTKIIVKTDVGNEVGMSTDDFAEHRHQIGKKPFDYLENTEAQFDQSYLYDKIRFEGCRPSFSTEFIKEKFFIVELLQKM